MGKKTTRRHPTCGAKPTTTTTTTLINRNEPIDNDNDDDKMAAGGNDNNDNDNNEDPDDDGDDKIAAGGNDNNDNVINEDPDDDGDDKMAAGGNNNDNDNENNKDNDNDNDDDDDDDLVATGGNNNNNNDNNDNDEDDDDTVFAGGNNNNNDNDDDDNNSNNNNIKSGLNGTHWNPPIGKRRSLSIHTKTKNVHHDDNDDDDTSDYVDVGKVDNVIDDNDDVDDDVDDDIDDVVKNDADVDDTSAYDDKVDNFIDNNNNVSNNVNFYNNLDHYTDTDTDDDDDENDNDENIDQDEYNDWHDNIYPTTQFSLCDYGRQHSSTLVIGEQVKYTKLERAVFRLNRLSNLHPCRKNRSTEIKKQFFKRTKCVIDLAIASNMNSDKYWSKHYRDFYILPKNGHYIPHIGGSTSGSFVNTHIKADVITDEIVIHIFQVWLKKYCKANGKHYKPRRNLLYTDFQKLAQMRANIPHLDPNTRAGFTDEMELVQMMIEDGEIHILIDGTDVTGGDNNRVRISKLVMSNQISKDGSKLEPSNRQKNRPTRHIFAFNCFSQAYLATPEDVVAGRIPILWYPPYEKDHANGKGGDNTMRNMNLKESSDNKTAFIKSRDKEKK